MTERSGLKQVAKVTLYAMGLLIFFVQFSFGKSVNVGKSGPQGKILKKYIEPTELKKLVENPVDSIWIIDVRSEKAYANSHIPTARSFPAGTVVSRLNEIPKSQYLIIYCTVGANAQIVSHKLKKAGYKRYINWGGISRWQWEKATENSALEK
jgi:rhodanese-related sulfurtransferase